MNGLVKKNVNSQGNLTGCGIQQVIPKSFRWFLIENLDYAIVS